jgi:hypothetical protein
MAESPKPESAKLFSSQSIPVDYFHHDKIIGEKARRRTPNLE